MRRKIKLGLHLFGLLVAVGVGVYFGFIQKGLSPVERIIIGTGLVTAALSALGKAFPVIDGHVDQLIPEDDSRPRAGGFATVGVCALLLALCWLAAPRLARAEGAIPGTLGATHLRLLAPASIAGLDLKHGTLQAGVYPGGGFGLGYDLFVDRWYTLTPNVLVAVAATGDRFVRAAFGFEFAKFITLGALVATADPLSTSRWYLLGGIDPIGLAHVLSGAPSGGS
jgi:hypothetical protein